MSDQFTEITVESWGSRIGGSIIAALAGLLLLAASIWGLAWNEGRAVTAATALRHAGAATLQATPDSVDPRNEGQLIHVTGMLKPEAGAWDPLFGVTADGLLRISREVEMYQWDQKIEHHSQQNLGGSQTTASTFTYLPIWSTRAISSVAFRDPRGHQNPPLTLRNADFYGRAVTLGAYRVSPDIIAKLNALTPVPPLHATPPAGFHPDGDGFYSGQDPAQPAIGDIRVRFKGLQAQTVSVVAMQSRTWLMPYTDARGYTISLAEPGEVTAAILFHDANSTVSRITWGLRAGGFVGVLVAFLLMAQPLAAIAAVLPFLGTMVERGAWAIAWMLSIPVTFITIALAWLSFRPIIGYALLAAALASLLLAWLRPRRAIPARP